jgi:D-sedoheptulose 7-phosphate isomerase
VKDLILKDIAEHAAVMERLAGSGELLETVEEVIRIILSSLRNGGRLYLFGCGGSAADSQHIAAEFVNRMHKARAALPAMALTTDTSVLTAIGNDDTFDRIFSRQVEALAKKGDVVIGISTSGSSESVILGLHAGRRLGATTVLLTGGRQDNSQGVADLVIRVPSTSTPRIQEAHITIAHIICTIVEQEYFNG